MSIKKIRSISTKNGDKGTSRNYSNEEFRKSNILFETLGSIDELSSFLGLTYHYYKNDEIILIQKNLQKLSSIIATSPDTEIYHKIDKLYSSDIDLLEEKMQKFLDLNPIESRLFLPGSEKTKVGAYFDVSRTLTRRIERRIDEFIIKHERSDLDIVRCYINRLSDYLFILSFNQ